VHLAELLSAQGAARASARRHALLRLGKIFAYATGAGVAVPLAREYEFLSLLVPAAVIAAATMLSFMRKEVELPELVSPRRSAPTSRGGTSE
jgi:uncharacterized membrane protein YoaK (UPF0700 family)